MQTTRGADKAARPVALEVKPGGIPAELKQLKRWVLWRYEWNQEKGKWDKPPLGPLKGHRTSVQRPGGWGTFNVALDGLGSKRGKAVGVGFVLSSGPDDPLDLVGIDIDDPALIPLLAPLATYTEGTPTAGKGGARALFRGKLPEGHTCRAAGGGAEVYESGRYFTVTGRRLGGAPAGLARPDQGTVAAVLRSLGLLGAHPPPAPPPPVEAREAVEGVEAKPTADDERRLGAAFAASNGAAFRRLWDGDAGDYLDKDGRPDTSRADLALCNFLAFYWEKDAAAVDRMFRRSGLFRAEKWDARHYQTGETYGQHTVNLAVRDCRATYTGRRHTSNGEAVAPKASTASRASTGGGAAGAGVAPSANGHTPPQGVPGVSAAALVAEDVQLFWAPWVPAGVLTLVAGDPETGKSTFLAFLAAHARSVLLIPGAEEGLGRMVVPRLTAHGCDLSRVHVLNDRPYSLPSDRDSLLRYARDLRADLLLVDPVDSVFPEGYSDNDPIPVRSFLESLAFVAERTGAAVVGVRHPGKAPGNVMPGSRQWRAVPRVILQMQRDKGPPERRVLRPWKYSVGPWPSPVYFDLPAAGKRPVFRPGAPVDPQTAQLFDDEPRRLERGKVVQARLLLRRLLKDGRMEAAMVLGICGKNGLPDTPVYTAKDLDGVVSKREGFGLGSKVYWVPPDVWPGVDEDDEEEGET